MRTALIEEGVLIFIDMQKTLDKKQKKQFPEIKDYEIISKIGQGGIAEIFMARQTSLNRPVAIKFLFPQFTSDSDIVRRFEQESVTIGRLTHPNIVHVIDKGKAGDRYYFIMEYVDGTSFKEIIYSKKHSLQHKLEIIIMVLKGLDYAHKNGVIHRDIKPANILLDKQGNALVADFGIAHIVNKTDPEMTDSDIIMGTLAYMSPEQKIASAKVEIPSDLYSVGVMVYEILAGTRPLGRFKMPSEINPNIPAKFDEILGKCLAPDPCDRYQRAVDLKDEILNVISRGKVEKEPQQNGFAGLNSFIGKSQFLDTLKETKYSSTMLVENKETHELFIIKKNVRSTAGLKEARLLANRKHKNIINIFGAGGDNRRLVVVMEYISGGSLAERMAQSYPFDEAMRIIIAAADALEFAHKNGIVHGNLRPSNILISRDDDVKVTDFGLPPHYNLQEKNWYAAPEKKVSKQNDVFSLGVILHQMLLGKNPTYDRSSNLFLGQTRNIIPRGMDVILQKMLAIRATKRYRSVEEFLADWDNLQKSLEDSKKRRVRSAPKKQEKGNKNKILIPVLIVVTIITILIILYTNGMLK
jgi:serine/threonine-protein kinase